MPWSSPYTSARASFSALRDVPSTVAPRCFAICAAAVPTPLPTAWIRTRSPGPRPPRVTSAS